MTHAQLIQRQSNLPVGYSPEEATFDHPNGREISLVRQPEGTWQAITVHDPALHEVLFLDWDTAMDQLRQCGYQVPAPAKKPIFFASQHRAKQILRSYGYEPVFLGGADVRR